MTKFVAAISIVAQFMGIIAIYWMLFEFFTLPEELLRQFTADADSIRRYVVETFASWQPFPFVGLVGAVLGWLLIWNGRCRDAWFLTASLPLACLWLPLIPVGTVIGTLVLLARARAIREQAPNSARA